ncbi:MAG: sulfatase, partial [Anaerolineales bacterium]|nr:sulfatase [Anaerolineales bacterium]
MNIIYIHTHDSGRYIQPYGHAIPTPNLMEMVQGGVLFRQCFSCAPTCSPSRAALLTGTNPHSAGMLGLNHRGFKLTNPTQHIASHLRANGYETVLCGEQHVITRGQEEKLGYTRILTCENQGENPADIRNIMDLDIANAKAVSRYLGEPPIKPFFLSFGMVCTHFPLPEPDADIDPGYVQPPPTLPDNEITRHDMAGYMTLARNADRCVGIVLEALEVNHLQEDTLVIFTTDHGVAFPKMKCTLFDEGIGVSLILRFPQGKYAGQVVDAMVSHLDIYPTLCHLVGIEAPTWLEGHSLVPLLDGKVDQIRDQVFAEVTYHAAYEPMRCIRTERYKYIRYFDEYEMVIKPNIDASSSKRFLIEHGLLTRAHDPKEMLFDLY